MTILITGSEGLIGRHLAASLMAAGHEIRRFDIARSAAEDVRDTQALRRALKGVTGIVVLAAVSRVIWAERDPVRCVETNVTALENLLRLSLEQNPRPWIVFASSREVYGEAERLPVQEDMPVRPVNLYARSKVKGEALIAAAARSGLMTNIFRLSSVYGCPFDHHDRVAMAFARAASLGGTIRIEGSQNLLDFTSVHDVVRGVQSLVEATSQRERLPPVHFVSGKGTTLAELAEIARRHAGHPVAVEEAAPRAFDVAHFVGDPSRAHALLGWTAEVDIADGLPALITDIASAEEESYATFADGSRAV